MHLRKTDYTQLHEYHYNQTDEYYQEAFAKMSEYFGDEIIPVIFSDDVKWCKNNMKWLLQKTRFTWRMT